MFKQSKISAVDLKGYTARIQRKQKRLRIMNALGEQLTNARSNQISVHSISSAYVYVIENSAFPGWYKVGTTVDIDARLASYQTSDPHRSYSVRFSKVVDNRFVVESSFLSYAERSSLFTVKNEWIESKEFKTLRNKLMNHINNQSK